MGDTLHFEDDDVPSDFFDDFSNQDFMAGLDVVDVWDDEETEEVTNNEKLENGSKPINQKRKNENSRRARRRRRSRDKAKRSRSRSGGTRKRNKNEEDDKMKRDPEKSKRDIQKDKDKWTKNNEAKILSEKLKVVETGLVPPGTEMDYDIKELKEMKSSINVVDLREKLRKRSRSSSFDLSTRLQRNRSRERRRSPVRRRSRSRSPKRRHLSPNVPLSPRRRSNSPRRRSSARRQSISPRRSLDRRSYAEQQGRFIASSPPRRRRYSRSRSPVLSDRESWLRNRSYRHKRSATPPSIDDRRRNAPKDFLEELADKLKYDEKKKKILQEISHKLNEPSRPNHQNQMFPHPPGMGPPPVSMGPPPRRMVPMGPPGTGLLAPPPNFFQPPPGTTMVDPAPQYDQSFFIGQPDAFASPNSNPNVFPPPYAKDFRSNLKKPEMVPLPFPHSNPASKKSTLLTEYQKEEDKKAATKLLADKTISLSDYLSMSAKYNDSSKPVNIHKKVKVLAQCQDAIKALGSSSQLNGQFFYTDNNKNAEKPTPMKCLSPLRKIPVTRFVFTTPWKGTEEKGSLHPPLQKLLVSMGLPFNVSTTEPKRSTTPLSTDSDIECILIEPAPELPKVTSQPKSKPQAMIRFQTKLTQTDVTKCVQCETRKAVKYVQRSSQCKITSVDCGTQITEEDAYRLGIKPSNVGLPKKSLAHLTAAQLLGKDEPLQRHELFPAAHITTPPPPNITSEKRHVDFSSRRGAQASNVTKPSLIDQLQSSMKPNMGGRQKFLENSNDVSNRLGVIDRDVRMSGFNRMPEFTERTPPFNQSRMVAEENLRLQQEENLRLQHEENVRLQQRLQYEENVRLQQRLLADEQMRMQQAFFEPPEHRDNYFNRGFSPRQYF